MMLAVAYNENEHHSNESDADSEFSFAVGTTSTEFLAPADELFCNGRIRPFYAVFGQESGSQEQEEEVDKETIRVPLQQLLLEEKRSTVSVVDGAVADSVLASSPGRCRKSGSTGSVTRWRRISELVGRSQSDGKEKFLFFSAQEKTNAKKEEEKVVVVESKNKANKASTNRTSYSKGGKGNGGGGGRKSYLPYRPELVGLFANMSGFRKSYHSL